MEAIRRLLCYFVRAIKMRSAAPRRALLWTALLLIFAHPVVSALLLHDEASSGLPAHTGIRAARDKEPGSETFPVGPPVPTVTRTDAEIKDRVATVERDAVANERIGARSASNIGSLWDSALNWLGIGSKSDIKDPEGKDKYKTAAVGDHGQTAEAGREKKKEQEGNRGKDSSKATAIVGEKRLGIEGETSPSKALPGSKNERKFSHDLQSYLSEKARGAPKARERPSSPPDLEEASDGQDQESDPEELVASKSTSASGRHGRSRRGGAESALVFSRSARNGGEGGGETSDTGQSMDDASKKERRRYWTNEAGDGEDLPEEEMRQMVRAFADLFRSLDHLLSVKENQIRNERRISHTASDAIQDHFQGEQKSNQIRVKLDSVYDREADKVESEIPGSARAAIDNSRGVEEDTKYNRALHSAQGMDRYGRALRPDKMQSVLNWLKGSIYK